MKPICQPEGKEDSSKETQTLEKIVCQDDHGLNDIVAFGSSLENTRGAVSISKDKGHVAVGVGLENRFPLVFADLVHRFDPFGIGIGEDVGADGAFPRDGTLANVVLEGGHVRGGVRHGGGYSCRGLKYVVMTGEDGMIKG